MKNTEYLFEARISLSASMRKLGFYTTVYVEALDKQGAELRAMELLLNDQKLIGCFFLSAKDFEGE